MTSYALKSIAFIHSPCREKFAVPRQPGLVPELQAWIEIEAEYARQEAFREIENFSHIWVLTFLHLAKRDAWQATVRPPRLGGNQRIGVFASRSPFRPNPIGLSAFPLLKVERDDKGLRLLVSGCDFVDGTPVIDIKPYVPYADYISEASGGYTERERAGCPLRDSRLRSAWRTP